MTHGGEPALTSPPDAQAVPGHEAPRSARTGAADGARADRLRGALARRLTADGHDALARVELAASELARLDVPPSARARVDTIRDAVLEIDDLLVRLDRVASPGLRRVARATPLSPVWTDLRARMRSALAARDVRLEPIEPNSCLALPIARPVLERILLGLLRGALVAAAPGEALTLAVRHVPGGLEIGLRRDETRVQHRGMNIPTAQRLELELELAEWGGQLVTRQGMWVGFWLADRHVPTNACEADRVAEDG